jgi:Tfp pilus assembly protein PilV
MRRLRQESGFTIVEVMVSTAILLTGVLGTLAMMNTANQRTRTASDRQTATGLARDLLEAVRSLNYRKVEPGAIVTTLQSASALRGNGSSSDWEITRGRTTYDVRVDVCSLDDPADGRGPRTNGTFCSDAVSAGTTDGSPADYKRVTTTVSWSGGSGRGSVRQSALVTSRGGGDAPAVSGLTMRSPTSAPITSTSVTSASFDVTTSVDAESVVWFIDDVQRGVASGSGTDFSFQWSLPDLDGAYEVTAQGYDDSAIAGEARSLTIVLNRYIPAEPTGFNAGRNGGVVEAEWLANPERDIVGYRVYRRLGWGSTVLACSTTTETSCIDPNPPNSFGNTLRYWVEALDRSPTGAIREGSGSTSVNVNISNDPPNAPQDLEIGLDSLDRVVLTWDMPWPRDPDGDSIEYLRIYRGGTTVGDRYDKTGTGSSESYVDDDPVPGSEYWITAVDEHMHESVLVGPVSL